MVSITSPTRPDKNYYINIVQQPDLTWTADEMPLDDFKHGNPFTGPNPMLFPGLRTLTGYNVTAYAQQFINLYAPPDLQRNFLNTLATSSTGTAHDNALAAMQWVASVNSYRDSQIANINTLTFAQLVAYVVPSGAPPWPAPPSTLPPVTPSSSAYRPPTRRI
jgi:hypothetical protein